jgi:hypothetical protein
LADLSGLTVKLEKLEAPLESEKGKPYGFPFLFWPEHRNSCRLSEGEGKQHARPESIARRVVSSSIAKSLKNIQQGLPKVE